MKMKVLIVSYNPFSMSNNGGKLFTSLFSEFDDGEVCQFYVSPMLPDGNCCQSFYQQTERNLLRYAFCSGKKGNVISRVPSVCENETIIGRQIKTSKFRSLKLIFRDVMWGFLGWETKKFKAWIEKEKPTCIFADTGDSTFLYKIAQRLSKKYNIPLYGYFSDDYYSIRAPRYNFVKRYQLWKLRKRIDSFVSSSQAILCINDTLRDYMKANVKGADNIAFHSIYMGNSICFENEVKEPNRKDLVFSYIGNSGYGRGENLVTIGREIARYNNAFGSAHKLRIYSRVTDEFLKECANNSVIEYMGFIPGHKVRDAILDSNVLIHTESFLPEYIEYTRFSLSTKIADSLASGRCLLAFGPAEVASINHLIKNNCAAVATSTDQLVQRIKEIAENGLYRKQLAQRGKDVADAIHNTPRNSQSLKTILF